MLDAIQLSLKCCISLVELDPLFHVVKISIFLFQLICVLFLLKSFSIKLWAELFEHKNTPLIPSFSGISVFWRHPMAFLTKAENMKIPVAGPYIRLGDFLTIDRSDPRSAIKTIRDAAELIRRDDISYGVYPEGTRNKTNEPLLPFHDGIPMIAQKAGVPIVVLCTKNTADITKRFPFRRTRVPFDVLHVYSAEEVASRRSTDLSEEIRNMILEHLEK